MIRQAGLRPSPSRLSMRALERGSVVEGHRLGQVGDGLRDASAVGRRRDVVRVDLDVHVAHGDHHSVVVPVIRAEDLEDRVAAGQGARDADRVHRRLGAGVVVAPPGQAEAPRELLRDDDPVLGGRGEVRAEPDALLDRLRDRRVRVPLRHRAEPVVEVPEATAVDVPHRCAFAPLEVDRPGLAHLIRGGDAAGEHAARPLEHALRALRRLVEPRALARGQLLDALPVDLRRRHFRAHAACPSLRRW